MGHFSATCAVSSLAIRGGTPIMVLLLTENPYGDGWDLRAPPIRAKYNDYGNIEAIDPDDAPITELWMKGLDVDMVERGVGDNTCHDVPTRRGMTFDDLCSALQEGRVQVRQDAVNFWHPPRSAEFEAMFKRKVESWRVTMPNVEAALGPELAEQLAVDCPLGNVVRLRRGEGRYNLPSTDEERRLDVLEIARQKLEENFAVMLTAGYGSAGFDDELLVCAKPGKERHHAGPVWNEKDPEKLLSVRWCFVRQDVWDGLLATYRPSWWGPGSIDEAVSRVCTIFAEMGTHEIDRILSEGYERSGKKPHFTALTGSGRNELVKSVPGVIGLDEHLALLKLSTLDDKPPTPEAVARTLDATAEMVHVSYFLMDARSAWAPLECCRGSQDPEWKEHLRFLRVVMAVANKEKRADDERYA